MIISGFAELDSSYSFQINVSDGDLMVTETYSLQVENFRPVILSITDVPEDQGGKVYIDFQSSFFDMDSLQRVEGYQIERMDDIDWVGVGTYNAYGSDSYIIEVNTQLDSSSSVDGMTLFRVIANMEEGNFASIPASGYSVDNIAPGVPTGLMASTIEGNIQVTWDVSLVEDFQYFLLKKSMTADFAEYESFQSTDTSYTDMEYEMDQIYFYRLAVADYAGNIGDYSETVEIAVLTIDGDLIPEVFALHQNYPNPFNPITTIQYDLPDQSQVEIIIFDIMGREVKILVNQKQDFGFKSVVWDATNNLGQPVSAGMYLYRISAGDFHQVKKMILLK
jgi:hypothetical protein